MKKYSIIVENGYADIVLDDGGDVVPASVAQALYDALVSAIDYMWEDTRDVIFDDTMVFGKGYDFDGLENLRWEIHTKHGSYAIWPTGWKNEWSAYGGNEGCYWNQAFTSEREAKIAIVRHISEIEPDHPAAKAYKALSLADGEE